MKPETQILKAARNAKWEINHFLSCCSAKEIKDSFSGFAKAADRLNRAINRMEARGAR